MAEGEVGRLFFDIGARLDKLEQALPRADKMVEEGAKKMDKKLSEIGDGFNLTKVQMGIAKFFAAGAALNQLGSVILQVWDSVERKLEEAGGAAATAADKTIAITGGLIQAIPVAGKFFELGQRIRAEISGQADEQRRLNEALAESAELGKRIDAQLKSSQAINAFGDEFAGRLSMAQAGDDPREILRVQGEQARADLERRIDSLRKGAKSDRQREQIEEAATIARQAIEAEFSARAAALSERMAAEADQRIREQNESYERVKAAQERLAKEQADAEKKVADEEQQAAEQLSDVLFELRQQELQEQEQFLKAEIEMISRHYDERIRQAKSAAEAEALERSKANAIAMAESEAAGAQQDRRVAVDTFSTALGSFRVAQQAGAAVTEKPATEEVQRVVADESRKQTRLLTRIESKIGTAGGFA